MTPTSADDTTVSLTLTGRATDVRATADTFTRRVLRPVTVAGSGDDMADDVAVAVAQMVEAGCTDDQTPLTLTLTRNPIAVVATVTMRPGVWDGASADLRALVAAIASESEVLEDGAVRTVFATGSPGPAE